MTEGDTTAGPTAANPHDHALVFGIGRYIGTAAGWPTDLRGPDNDAAAVAAWLSRADGGGLPPENVRVVCSADAPNPFQDGRGEPDQEQVVKAFKEIAQLPKEYLDEDKRQYAGRRLYVYVSGHGWATRSRQAVLVTAEAVKERPVNVDITSWTDQLTEAAQFQQIVLWADSCATRTRPTLLQGTPIANGLLPRGHPNAPFVRVFESFAAGIGLRAVEHQMPDGNWHGAFTYALLRGLEGEAPTPVTSDSLTDYLRNAMKQFQSPEDQQRGVVAHEPSFGRRDPDDVRGAGASDRARDDHVRPLLPRAAGEGGAGPECRGGGCYRRSGDRLGGLARTWVLCRVGGRAEPGHRVRGGRRCPCHRRVSFS